MPTVQKPRDNKNILNKLKACKIVLTKKLQQYSKYNKEMAWVVVGNQDEDENPSGAYNLIMGDAGYLKLSTGHLPHVFTVKQEANRTAGSFKASIKNVAVEFTVMEYCHFIKSRLPIINEIVVDMELLLA